MVTGEKTELLLDGESIPAQELTVDRAYFEVPESFTVTIGGGATATDLVRRFPPGTEFTLSVRGVVQHSGRIP